MDHKELCEHTRIRLIAAAIGHQQCTKTAACIVSIPGGDRVIAIGTPAQMAGLVGLAPVADDFDDVPVRLPSGTKAVVRLPRPFTLEDGVHLMNFLSNYIEEVKAPAQAKEEKPLMCCAAGRDGECANAQCPQLRDNEPQATGRHCPLDSEGGHHD